MDAIRWLFFCSLLIGVAAHEPSVSIEILTNMTDVRDGNTVRLQCTALDIQHNFSLQIDKNKMPLQLQNASVEPRLTVSSLTYPNGIAHIITIMSFNTSEDAGDYGCYARATSEAAILASDEIFLSVLNFPDPPICSPNGSYYRAQHEQLTISCASDRGYPRVMLQIDATPANNDSWDETENDVKLIKSVDLTLSITDNGVSYLCSITSPEYFPNMQNQCLIGPIYVHPLTTSDEHPHSQPTTDPTTDNQEEISTSSTGNSTNTQTLGGTFTSPLPSATAQSSVAVGVIVTLAVTVTVLLMIVVLVILRRLGYWKWVKDEQWTNDGDSEDVDAGLHTTENIYQIDGQSQDAMIQIDESVDPMYQEIPHVRTLPEGNASSQITTNEIPQKKTFENSRETTLPGLTPVRPMSEFSSTRLTEDQQHRERAFTTNDVIYARPIKKSKSTEVKSYNGIKNNKLDFSHLYAKINKRNISRCQPAKSTNSAFENEDVDASASAYCQIPLVVTSSQETPSSSLDDPLASTDKEHALNPEHETPYAEIPAIEYLA